jgi:S-DNA-T family DNA segregation ATPase FtsK/SpoIIIE
MMSVQVAMRFPRSNFLNPINHIEEEGIAADEQPVIQAPLPPIQEAPLQQHSASQIPASQRVVVERRPNADEIAAREIEGRGTPAWQSAFTLAPNVRFTRTPESAVAKRDAEKQPEQAIPVAAQSVVQAVPVAHEKSQPFVLPQQVNAPRALSQRLQAEFNRQQQLKNAQAASTNVTKPAYAPTIQRAALPVAPQQSNVAKPQRVDAPVEPAVADVSPSSQIMAIASNLSDHLFWEAMSLDVVDDVAPVAAPSRYSAPVRQPVPVPVMTVRNVRQPSVHLPTFNPAHDDVIALYREVGSKPEAATAVAAASVV